MKLVQDDGKVMQMWLVMYVVIDRVESITEHSAATVVRASSSGASEGGLCTHALVSRTKNFSYSFIIHKNQFICC